MFIFKCIAILLFSLTTHGKTVSGDEFELDILHYNDFHTRFEETSLDHPICRTNDDNCLGGFPRLYWAIKNLLKQKPKALLLDAGDSFQGTYWDTFYKGEILPEFMNMLPHTAHAIGNHDFDGGPVELAKYISALHAPVVAANIDSSNEPALQDTYQPYIVMMKEGRKIGIIGVTTTATSTLSFTGNVTFQNPVEVVRSVAANLTMQGIDIVIVLSHCGIHVDRQIAREAGDNVDIIVGGHTHTLLWNGKPPKGEKVYGPYPIFETSLSKENHKVVIVQASSYTKYMGNLTVIFDNNGDYVRWEGGPIFLNRSVPEAENIKALLASYATEVHKAENEVVGSSEVGLYFGDCYYGECDLGDLIVDAFNEQARSTVNSSFPLVALLDCGDIKASLSKGQITKADVFELLPFNDRLLSYVLKGHVLREALEVGVTAKVESKLFDGGVTLQVSNIEVVYNISNPVRNRITSVRIHGKDLDDQGLYQVTSGAFTANSRNVYSMLHHNKKDVQLVGREREVVEAYIKNNSPIKHKNKTRITIIY